MLIKKKKVGSEEDRKKNRKQRRKRMNNHRNTFFIGKLPLLLCVYVLSARSLARSVYAWHSSLFFYLFIFPLFIRAYKNGDIKMHKYGFLYRKRHLTNATKINFEWHAFWMDIPLSSFAYRLNNKMFLSSLEQKCQTERLRGKMWRETHYFVSKRKCLVFGTKSKFFSIWYQIAFVYFSSQIFCMTFSLWATQVCIFVYLQAYSIPCQTILCSSQFVFKCFDRHIEQPNPIRTQQPTYPRLHVSEFVLFCSVYTYKYIFIDFVLCFHPFPVKRFDFVVCSLNWAMNSTFWLYSCVCFGIYLCMRNYKQILSLCIYVKSNNKVFCCYLWSKSNQFHATHQPIKSMFT